MTVGVSIKVVNAEIVRKGLEDFTAEIPRVGRRSLLEVAQKVYRRLYYTQTQPPRRTYEVKRRSKRTNKTYVKTVKQKYVRTFTLRASRAIVKLPDGYLIKVAPEGPKGQLYGPYVVGVRQRWFHQGRWTPVSVIGQEEVRNLPTELRRNLMVALSEETAKVNKRQ